MNQARRETFDGWLEEVLGSLPPRLAALLDEAPLIVDDRPDAALLEQLGIDAAEEDLCGLHTGTPLTERSVDVAWDHPETVHLFREGIVAEAGGWRAGAEAIREQIRITLLHELGHHFGLEEDDLDELGYA